MRTEFLNAYEATAEPAPWEKFTQIIPADARISHYTWMSPAPGLNKFAGHRRFGKINTIRYSVESKEFDAAFEVLLRDIQDDQTGGYMLKPKELAARAKLFPGRWSIKTLSNGSTTVGYDGSNFFASSHNIGTVNNIINFTSQGSSDGNTLTLCALYVGGPLKPLIWQNRKGPDFENDAGSPESKKRKSVHYWIDLEGESAFGYPWDAIQVNITNTPNVTDMHTVYNKIDTAFRGFQLPKALASEDGEYIHEQTVFNSDNLWMVGSPHLANLLRQSLNQDWVPQAATAGPTPTYGSVATTNLWKGFASYTISNFLSETGTF
jgi:phage major head subunit gpT-like protein